MEKLGPLFPDPKPVYLIPGNTDSPFMAERSAWFPTNFKQMHNRFTRIDPTSLDLPIFLVGFGGANMGIYNVFAFSEREMHTALDALFQQIVPIRSVESSITILLLHDPPFNSKLDLTFMHTHVRIQSVRQIIEQYQPDLAVMGHIHESKGIDLIGTTTCVNAGEAKAGNYAIININAPGDITMELKHV